MLQTCRVWKYDPSTMEAILVPKGQSGTVRTTKVEVESADVDVHMKKATLSSPQYARVSLGDWDESTCSYVNSKFYLPSGLV